MEGLEISTNNQDGYAFELPNESDDLLTVSEFTVKERLCCPFFDFALEIEREGGPMWLCLKGRDGVKLFIMAEIGETFYQLYVMAAAMEFGCSLGELVSFGR